MTDQYQTFAKSPIGKFVIKNLGLPSPTFLDRFESATPVVKGAVLLGAAPASDLSASIAQVLANVHANSYAGNNAELQQAAAKVGLNLGVFNPGDKEFKFKVVVFDASGIENSEQLKALYEFFFCFLISKISFLKKQFCCLRGKHFCLYFLLQFPRGCLRFCFIFYCIICIKF